MYKEPWFDINEYPRCHKKALEHELLKEVHSGHLLHEIVFKVLAKREDQDEILVESENHFFIVHLTWSGKSEINPFPTTIECDSKSALVEKLEHDSEVY